MKNHYIIGDIHGEYQILLKLIEKLPKDAKYIFALCEGFGSYIGFKTPKKTKKLNF